MLLAPAAAAAAAAAASTVQFSRPIGEALECGHARLHRTLSVTPPTVSHACAPRPLSLFPLLSCVASAHDFCCSSAAAAAVPLLPPQRHSQKQASPQLFLTTGELDRQRGPAVYFLRTTKPGVEVADGSPETALSFGTLPARAIGAAGGAHAAKRKPMVEQKIQGVEAGRGRRRLDRRVFNAYGKFGDVLGEAVSSLQGGFTLRRPDNLFDIENKAAAFNRAGGEPHIVKAFEDVADEWCVETEKLLAENDNARAESDDAGPETELEYWRTRMAKFNAIPSSCAAGSARSSLACWARPSRACSSGGSCSTTRSPTRTTRRRITSSTSRH